ncbi:MAG: succinyldiaminopimelate transaminase [Gammaproteobacteria bacterium]|nr:succinyldiaminopimelate transaminase [Gammaproteobacteria bacterium]
MNPRLEQLQPYPFHKLARLIQGVSPASGKGAIRLSVGEPQHAAPAMVLEELAAQLATLSSYPTTRGQAALRTAIAAWATRRFGLDKVPLDPERHVLPACGTREALFSAAQAVVDRAGHARPIVMMPNPFYQIYEGAALLAGAEPYYLNTLPDSGYRMEFERVPEPIWARTQLVYVCSPGNPTGAVMGHADYARLIELAQRHDFIIASDECYSEIYFDEAHPPTGLLQVANDLGLEDYRHCLVFHSLSKRSNLPGLRSGFVAGDGAVMEQFFQYRTYHGCTLPGPTQAASIRAWGDEAHVAANRAQYRAKFEAALDILAPVMDVQKPQAGFYLWARTPQDDESFARGLYARENVLVLPGSYLSREADGVNPGRGRVRLALVAPLAECTDAAQRIKSYVESL